MKRRVGCTAETVRTEKKSKNGAALVL
ncbi:hypothetical protein, partial [Salmonella enterica]